MVQDGVGYTCPECGYTESPVTHRSRICDGVVVRTDAGLACEDCDARIEDISCPSCGYQVT